MIATPAELRCAAGTREPMIEQIVERLLSHWQFKTMITVALTLFFCVFYFALQRLEIVEVRKLELTWIDHLVEFDPSWVWVYQSTYLLTPVTPWLATSRRQLRSYSKGFVLLSLSGFAFFAFFPVSCPRPATVPEGGMYGMLIAYDGTSNAFPSLHCALAAYAVLFGSKALREELSRRAVSILTFVLTLWTVTICYSTLATKQHYFVDLPAGVALAWLSHWLVWKRAPRTLASAPAQDSPENELGVQRTGRRR